MRWKLPEDLAALDELLLKGDAWPATRPIMTLVLVLASPPLPGSLDAVFAAAVQTVPRMRQRVARSVWTAGRASWVDDDDFDLAHHMRRTHAPGDGTLDAVLEWAGERATAPFDPARPLWESVLVEDLIDGRAAVVMRAHHAIADGVRAIQMLAALLELEPASPASPPFVDTGASAFVLPPNAAQLLRILERGWISNPREATAFALLACKTSLHPLRAVTETTSYLRSALRTMDRGSATPSPLLERRSSARRLRTLEFPLDTLKATARAADVTINDVYLTGLLGGMRRYYEALGLPATDVPLGFPIDVGGDSSYQAGNHISAATIPGPASIRHPLERLQAVHELVASRRAERGLSALDRLAPTLRQVPARVAIAAMGTHARRVDLQASNLVGPPFSLYLAGEKVDRMFAFGPLPGVPAMAVLASYDGICTIGLTIDPAAVTDIPLLLESLKDSYLELFAIGDTSAATRMEPSE